MRCCAATEIEAAVLLMLMLMLLLQLLLRKHSLRAASIVLVDDSSVSLQDGLQVVLHTLVAGASTSLAT